ncbi:zf-CCHC domain-containing protein, partial [Tanacetum coccineum]
MSGPNSVYISKNCDDYIEDPNLVTLISKLDISDPLHLHPNDTTALTVVSIKLKGTKNYQVWSCAMLLALEGKSKTGFIDGTCKRSNTDVLHPRIHQKHWTDPGDEGSVSHTFGSLGTDLNFKRFETYVKAKDLDLWHIILNGDFPPLAKNEVTKILEVVLFEEQSDDLKKKLAKNNESKMVLYNVLPKKEYERIFMCKTAKDIWQSLLITHQEESIDSSFARFNTIITILKALDEGFSGKNYVRKFLRALHPKWRAKVMTIKELKDLSSLALDELIGNLKVHEVVMEKDSEIYRGKKERVKSIALKAKKESSDDETSTSRSDDEEYAMAVRNFKKFFRRKGKFVRQPREEKKSFRQRDEKKGKSDQKCFRCGDPNHLIGDCPKPSRNKDQKAFNGMTPKTKLTTKLVSWLNHQMSLCEISLKIINKNKILKTKRDLLEKEILELNEKIKKLERSKEIEIACKSCDELKLENAKLKETQVKFVKFDKSANSLREMLNNQKSPSCKIGLGFDSDKASTSGTKTMSFVGSSAEKATDGSTIKGHGSTLPGSVSRKDSEKGTEHVFSPPMSSRSDFVITRKKLIHNSIDESKKPSLKPSLKSGIGYVKTESRSKTPPPRRNISSQPRYNTPQSRRNSRQPIHQNFYPMNWNNQQNQGFVHMGNYVYVYLYIIRCKFARIKYRTGASGSNPPPVTIHTWLERFNKQKPCLFEKAVAPVDAENWISYMEKIFDVMDCNDAFKTRLAVYKFKGDALAWWKAYKQAKGGDAWVLTLTWAAFKELFFLQFFPQAKQERLKREYHSIRQRASENSTEYMQRFLRLAGFLRQAAG